VPTATADEYLPTKKELNETWGKFGVEKISFLHTRDPQEANSKEFLLPLKDATAIWFGGGDQRRLSRAYSDTVFEKEVCRLLDKGVVVGGTSAGAAIQSKVMIEGGRNVPEIGSGLNLLPSSIIDQHFLERSRLNRLARAVELHPARTGIGISERTAIIIEGKQATVVGSGFVISIQIQDEKLDLKSWESGSTFDLDQIGL
jgi:cyanophycinase